MQTIKTEKYVLISGC